MATMLVKPLYPVEQRPKLPKNYFETILRPCIAVLAIFGCADLQSENKCLRLLYNLYTIFIVFPMIIILPMRCLMTINFEGSLTDPGLSLRLILVVWCIQCLVAAVSAAWITRRGHLYHLAKMWVDLNLDELLESAGASAKRNRKKNVVQACFLTSFLILAITLVVNVAVVRPTVYPENVFGPPELQYLAGPCMILAGLFWICHKLLYTLVMFGLVTAWTSFGQLLEKSKSPHEFPEVVEWTMIKHDQMAAMIQYAGSTFGFYTMSQLVFTTPTVILELYVFALGFNTNQQPFYQCALAFWAFYSIVQFGVICYASAVHTAANEVGHKFYRVFVAYSCASNGEPALVTMQKATALMARMHAGDVSITVLDMAPIRNGFTLAMMSLIFNYFFLLLQFALQGPASPDAMGRRCGNDSSVIGTNL